MSDRKDLYIHLFKSQMATLKERGYPQTAIDEFEAQQKEVIDTALIMSTFNGNIPFIPVYRCAKSVVAKLMKTVQEGTLRGYAPFHIDLEKINDESEITEKFYFIYDVEDGGEMTGESPSSAKNYVKDKERHGLTLSEGIALCVHTRVLSKHAVGCAGSNYVLSRREITMPGIQLSEPGGLMGRGFQGRPEITWRYLDMPLNEWGVASCLFRK